MNTAVALVNFILMPIISLSLYYRQKNRQVESTFQLLMYYCIAVSFNVVLSRLFASLLGAALSRSIEPDSLLYSAPSLLSALILPMFSSKESITKVYNAGITQLLLAVLTVMVFFVDPSITEIKRFQTYSIQYTLIAILVFILFIKTKSLRVEKYHTAAFAAICIVFGLINTSGLYLYHAHRLLDTAVGWSRFFLYAAVHAYLFFRVLTIGTFCYVKYAKILETKFFGLTSGINICRTKRLISRYDVLVFSLIIFICWLPWLIAYYPASIEWDTYYPIKQYLGLEPRTNHFPWFYVIVVGNFYKLGLWLGDKNVGMFLYILIRDMICAVIFGRAVYEVKKNIHNRLLWVLTLAFYGITPVWGAYAKCAFKNTLANALFTLLIIYTVIIVKKMRRKKDSISDYMKFGASALFFSLFLNNGIFVVVPISIIILVVALLNRKKEPFVILLFLAVFFSFEKVIQLNGVRQTEKWEALALPIQQLSRTVKYNADEFTDEELSIVSRYADLDTISNRYDSLISDPVKELWVKPNEELIDLMRVWWHFAYRFPKTYCEAFIAHAYGYIAFVPREPDVAYGYSQDEKEHAANFNSGMTYFGWVEDVRFSEELTCTYVGEWEGFRRFLHAWAILWDGIPILCLTDTIPLYTWGLVLSGYILMIRKRKLELIPLAAMLIMTLTCIASPVNGCFRYFSAVAAAFPMMAILLEE